MTRFTATLLALLIPFTVLPAAAQPARTGRLLVTVVDPSGGVIPDATVTLVGQEDATRKAVVAPTKTSDKGIATIAGLALGRYEVQAEFSGFNPGILKDVRIRAGDNKHIVVLPLQNFTDTITVGRDAQEAAADRAGRFGSALTREQIDALSDDPAEMQRQLQEMAGPGAVTRIDSFEGGNLPPKAQIKAIHITRDAFAAENHGAGGLFIDIITQPGMGPLRGNMNFRLRDGSMSGRSPFTETKGPEQTRSFGINLSGSLIKERSSFSLSFNGMSMYETPNLNVALPGGTRRSEALSQLQPRDNAGFHSSLDYAITRDQTLRVGYSFNRGSQSNLGIGGYDLPERAYSSSERFHFLRIQEAGPLGRRFFTNTRLQINWTDNETDSALEGRTIRVNDAFTSGGQQMAGGNHSRIVNLASDLDYVRGIHSVRTGIVLDARFQHSNDTTNYLGTYTFESLEAFEAGIAKTYTQRLGDPDIRYFNLQAGFYVQDDIRVRKGLTLSPGVRYEAQTHLDDVANFAPRIGLTWAPFKSGKTTLRTSWGIFYDWLAAGTYEQTLRVDGFRQQELNIVDPSYPEPGSLGVIPPINRYLLGDETNMAQTMRVSAGIDHAFTPRVRVFATYANARGTGLLRGRNLNLPIDGIRPDRRFANIVEVVSDADSRQQSVSINGNVSFSPPGPPGGTGRRFDWKRTGINANFFVGRTRNNTDGAFRFPPNGVLATEWGPAPNDVRYRGSVGFNTSMLRNLNVNFFLTASTGTPYTIRTGRDDNGDLEFNDRPLGEERNSARTAGQMNLSGFVSYVIPFGGRTVQLPPGIRIMAPGAGPVTVETIAQPDAKRYRLTLNANIQNLTNHKNYTGYSGIMTSRFFRTPTTVMGTRKIDLGMSFSF